MDGCELVWKWLQWDWIGGEFGVEFKSQCESVHLRFSSIVVGGKRRSHCPRRRHDDYIDF